MRHWLPAPAASASTEAAADAFPFTPVPRKQRAGGWTAERQRAFVAGLAATGSVKAAARRVNMASEGAYALRRHPEGTSFAAAWDAALASGAQTLADIAIDRAIEGVAVPIFHKGEQVGEKRWYNDRLLMFLMRHRLPAQYGPPPPLPAPAASAATQPANPRFRHRRGLPAALPAPTPEEVEAEANRSDFDEEDREFFDKVFRLYQRRLAEERRHRLSGRVVAADLTVRELVHIELMLECGGRALALLDLYANAAPGSTEPDRNAGPLSEALDDLRRHFWEEAGEPERPPLDLRPNVGTTSIRGGPSHAERFKAREGAQATIAAAQAVWEAAASEGSWARYNAGSGEAHEAGVGRSSNDV